MKTCFLSINVEKREEDNSFQGVEKLDNILNIFKKHKVDATLFITGEILQKYPGLVKKWSKNYEIACHNYSHVSLDQVEIVDREKQIKNFILLYKKILARIPKGFRAPRNIIDNEQFPILEAYGFLYDSSVFSRHLKLVQKYKGRVSNKPYYPRKNNYLKKDSLARMKILEIPGTSIHYHGLSLLKVPLTAIWLRKLGFKAFKLIFSFARPKYISFSMHSWDGVKFFGKGSKNSGEIYLGQLDKMLNHLKKIGYEFKSGQQIYEESKRAF